MNTNEKKPVLEREFGVKLFLGIAVLLIVIVLGWGLGRAYPKTAGSWSLANVFVSLTSVFKPAETIMVASSLDTVSSGKTVVVAWQNPIEQTMGSYSLFYPCIDGVSATTTVNGKSEMIVCNSDFNFENKNNNIAITVLSEKKHSTTFNPEIHFAKNNEKKVSAKGSTEIKIINEAIKEEPVFIIPNVATHSTSSEQAITQATSTLPKTNATSTRSTISTSSPQASSGQATPKKVATPTPKAPVTTVPKPQPVPSEKKEKIYTLSSTTVPTYTNNPVGKPDFVTNILDVGYVDLTTNVYSATSTPRKSERTAVRFVVTNIGTKETGNWFFNAVLPTFPTNIFTSEGQTSLMPGDRVEFTIGFDGVLPDGGTVVINVDPANSISEKDEENNIAKIQFTLTQ